MRKRSLVKIFSLGSVILVIAILTIFYSVRNNSTLLTPQKNQTSPSTEPPPSDSEANHISSTPSPIVHISDSQALVLYEQGLKLYYQRQFPEALIFFNQALQIDPLCYEALNAKGAALAFQGNYDQGLALIKQALDLNPSFVYANFNQGLAYELAGRWDEAIASYQKTLQLDDRDTWSYYGIASIYGRQGNVDKVLEYLKLAISLDADVKEVARNEHDFLPVRNDPRFQSLVQP